jgi:hypothetical protein
MPRTPWIGLIAVVAMFVIPLLPEWVFTGPRTIRHWPQRHLCAECGSTWSDGHVCDLDDAGPRQRRLPRVELRRVRHPAQRGELSSRPSRSLARKRF